MTAVLGLHHVTAIASDPQRNLDFYSGLLGLRLVKRTVNFDDPQTYHLYYGDESGTPGSIMTFFPWPGARAGRQGAGQVAITSFAVLPRALGFWVERLVQHGIKFEGPVRRHIDGKHSEQVIAFKDHDGTMLEIVAHTSAESRGAWGGAPGISQDHALHGFHSVTMWVDAHEASERVLIDTLGFRAAVEFDGTRRYVAGDGAAGAIVNVRAVGGFLRGTGGAGTVHHVAWAVRDDAAQIEVRAQVDAAGLRPTGVIDRNYFHSVYFHEPGGVLFELATLPPGFTVDEPLEQLGEHLKLPAQYEPARAEIEAVLPRIHLSVSGPASVPLATTDGPEDVSGDALGFVHQYIPAAAGAELAGSTTLLMLHGTGGDEHDLIPLAQQLLPGAGILSPRGKVLEGSALRFFRRLAEGVFDQEDLALRTAELAAFIHGAAGTYGLDRTGIVAVGFSNGANIAASLLLRGPKILRSAVLLSPMMPFEPKSTPDVSGVKVFIGAGRTDPIAPVANVERLVALLRSGGADVTVHWEAGGHSIAPSEIAAARNWIRQTVLREDARP